MFRFISFHTKTFIGANPLCSRFRRIYGFIKIYDRIKNLVLFCPEGYDAIHNSTRYLIGEKSGITYIVLIIIL